MESNSFYPQNLKTQDYKISLDTTEKFFRQYYSPVETNAPGAAILRRYQRG
ncbi:hypothetical protein Pan54_48400 [Rubinisphaera italica]|uniref:Uncharacterized protein n=1 Tax=Rubinisphaera italica TaxID=2527969 RepID=A0A5C5XNG8_9PLAN|nr:hypothetical protein Pan54_48400 [Rubinisphaera italica]